MIQTAKIDKLITLQNLKDFYGLLQDNFIATENKYGAIKVGYEGSGQKYPVKLDAGKAYVEVPWGYSQASARTDGLMSSTDKKKFDSIEFVASKFILGSATDDKFGGFRTGYTLNDKNYPVQLDSMGKAYINVPWKNTYNKTQGSYGISVIENVYIPEEGEEREEEVQGINTIKLDLYENEDPSSPEGVAPIKLATAIEPIKGSSNSDFEHKIYPVCLDKNDKLAVLVPWENSIYNLSTAADEVLGGIKIGYESPDTTVGWDSKHYAVQLDENDKAFVYVPWTDTEYTLPSATDSDLGGIKLGYTSRTRTRVYGVQLDENDKAYVEIGTASKNNMGIVKIGETNTAEIAVQINDDGELYVKPSDLPYKFGTGVTKSNGNSVYLNLKDTSRTKDKINDNIKWGPEPSTIPDNSEYFACPVYLDDNGQLYVRVPIIKGGVTTSTET